MLFSPRRDVAGHCRRRASKIRTSKTQFAAAAVPGIGEEFARTRLGAVARPDVEHVECGPCNVRMLSNERRFYRATVSRPMTDHGREFVRRCGIITVFLTRANSFDGLFHTTVTGAFI
jgi:hypothetical protein